MKQAEMCILLDVYLLCKSSFQCKDTPKLCNLSAFSIKNNISMII